MAEFWGEMVDVSSDHDKLTTSSQLNDQNGRDSGGVSALPSKLEIVGFNIVALACACDWRIAVAFG